MLYIIGIILVLLFYKAVKNWPTKYTIVHNKYDGEYIPQYKGWNISGSYMTKEDALKEIEIHKAKQDKEIINVK